MTAMKIGPSPEVNTGSATVTVREPATQPVREVAPVAADEVGGRANVAPEQGAGRHSATDLARAVGTLNRLASELNTSVHFRVDDDTHRVVVKVVDANSGETVRQIPPEDMIRVMVRLEEMIGVLFDKKM